jgi:tetratricopeptide (TPR) repeat protein
MNLKEILPTADQLKLARGIEANLLQRRRKGLIGGIVGISAAVLQVVLAVAKDGYADHLGQFFKLLFTRHFAAAIGPEGLPINGVIGMGIIVVGFGVYFTYRWTSLLTKESKEPFQYTFWVDPFEEVSGTPCERFTLTEKDRLNLFHHDLMERLSLRIRRLALLNANVDVPAEARANLTSHIHVKGCFAVRQLKGGKWVLQIMPMIRIGPVGRPETLPDPVKIELSPRPAAKEQKLEPVAYDQLVERVYSIVASAIYKQIRSDLKVKSTLFPTSYLRAVALYHEAVDFERSNTIDAYDDAITLYRESKEYFDVRWMGSLSRVFVKLPILWRLVKRSLIADAGARVGLARSLIYRRVVSAMSGRTQNVLFEIPNELKLVIENLTHLQNRLTPERKFGGSFAGSNSNGERTSSAENTVEDRTAVATANFRKGQAREHHKSLITFLTFPNDSLGRRIRGRHRRDIEMQRRALSGAYAVAALANYYLGARKRAAACLNDAKAIHPTFSQQDPIWFLAQAEVEFEIDKKLLFLKQATDLDPNFEIAQYRCAKSKEMKLRLRGEIKKDRVGEIIKEYDRVLEINPANIGAVLAEGYLLWLLQERSAAEKKFEEGCEIKAIARQTFTGESLYGLARIAVEKGEINEAYRLYTEAIFADPEVAVYDVVGSKQVIQGNYNFITRDILKRYEEFRRRAKRMLRRAAPALTHKDSDGARVDIRTLNNVSSFVLNDYGNACLNYFHRFGDPAILRKAIKAYETAIKNNDENFVAYYNLSNSYGWSEGPQRYDNLLQKAEKLAPAWPAVLIESVRSQVQQTRRQIESWKKELETAQDLKVKLQSRLEDEYRSAYAEAYRDLKDATVEAGPAKLAESITEPGQKLPIAQPSGSASSESSKISVKATENLSQATAPVETGSAEVPK